MQTNTFDLSLLPPQAQIELYDFYLFLQQRYAPKKTPTMPISEKENALNHFLANNKKRHLKIAPDIDLTALADEINDMDI